MALVVDADPRLRRIAVFDAAVNNTDRKAGHLVPVPGGHVYGVDHGVTFSPVPKLRTVLWEWRGQPFADEEVGVLRALRAGLDGALGDELRALLDPIEVRGHRAPPGPAPRGGHLPPAGSPLARDALAAGLRRVAPSGARASRRRRQSRVIDDEPPDPRPAGAARRTRPA